MTPTFPTIRYTHLSETDTIQDGDEFDRHGDPEAYHPGWCSFWNNDFGKKREYFPGWSIRRPDLDCLVDMALADLRLIVLDGEAKGVGRFVRAAALDLIQNYA